MSTKVQVRYQEVPLKDADDHDTQNETTHKNLDSKPARTKGKSPSTSSDIVCTTCMELALEGERLCQAGDLSNGVKFLEEAIKLGTSDPRTLSAIYSQLGNALFYLEDYDGALEYHKRDVLLVHELGDQVAEAKACGNLGNTLKMVGKFDEAAMYCRRHLEISRKLNDQVVEGRALYNLGNVHHLQGRRMIGPSQQETGILPNDIKSSLECAIQYYEASLKVATKGNDQVSMGRTHGQLGNTHYLLGNFEEAIESHKKRLELAKQTSDRAAEKRAYCNLGNANVLLGNYPSAIENYLTTIELAKELKDATAEAQASYSLANTYALLHDYKSSLDYHLKYLDLVKKQDDKVSESVACWSLVNIYQIVNDLDSALIYAERQYELAQELGDKRKLSGARSIVEQLRKTIIQNQEEHRSSSSCRHDGTMETKFSSMHQKSSTRSSHASTSTKGRVSLCKPRRVEAHDTKHSQEEMSKQKLNRDLANANENPSSVRQQTIDHIPESSSNDRLFDMIARLQGGRLDDQRCEIVAKKAPVTTSENVAPNLQRIKSSKVGTLNKDNGPKSSSSRSLANLTDANKFSQPLSVAASAIKATFKKASLVSEQSKGSKQKSSQDSEPSPTAMPDEEHCELLFDLIAVAQGQRMDEQRSALPDLSLAKGVMMERRNTANTSRQNPYVVRKI